MLADSDVRTVFRLLQASCLAPYKIGKDRITSKRSILLSLYNVSFAAFVIYNIFHAESDARNNVDYDNKSFLIGIAFDTIDVLENLHPCFISVRAILFTKAGIDIWFKIDNINQKFRQMNVEFEDKTVQKYILAKAFFFLVTSVLFLTADIILCWRSSIFYTANYWILCAVPLIQNSAIAAAFGGLVLILYQRFWAINELIIRAINFNTEAWAKVSWQQMKFENLRGNYSNRYYLNQSINLKKFRLRPQAQIPDKKPPFTVMLKNYECFGRNFYNERNISSLIRILKILHFDLFEVTKDVNSIFGWNLLFVFTTAFFGVTINMYFVIIYHLRSYNFDEYVSCLLWMSAYLFKIIYLIAYTTTTSKEAQRTIELLHELINDLHNNDSLTVEVGSPVKYSCSSKKLKLSRKHACHYSFDATFVLI